MSGRRASLLAAALAAIALGLAACATAGFEARVVGEPIAFDAPRLDGQGRLALGDLHGEVVLVDFWASWCGPCREAMGAYEGLARRLGSGFAVVGVSVDEARDDALRFAAEVPATFPRVWDEGLQIVSRWHPETLPTALLVDARGVVRAAFVGFDEGTAAAIEARARRLMAERSGL